MNKARPGSLKCKARNRFTCVVVQVRTKVKHLRFSAAPELKRGGPNKAYHSFFSQLVLFTAAGSKVTQLHHISAGLECRKPNPRSKDTELGAALILPSFFFFLFCPELKLLHFVLLYI